jgi:putative transposase
MNCPHCQSSSTTEQEERTVHGSRRYRCRDCGRRFNERTGTALNRVQVPTDIVFLVVFWRLRYKLSLRDLAGALASTTAGTFRSEPIFPR